MASAKHKQALIAKELAGQPDIADENDNVEAPMVQTNVVPEGTLSALIAGDDEGDTETHDEKLVRDHELDKEIEAIQRRLRSLKLRKMGGMNVKLKPGQKLVVGGDGRTYIVEEMVGEKGHTAKRVSCIEYEPN